MELQFCRTREERLKKALFRGGCLTLANPRYLGALRAFTEELLRDDLCCGDLTAEALGNAHAAARASVFAKEPGVAAGLEEAVWFLSRHGLRVETRKHDGDAIQSEEELLRIEGRRKDLLSLERVGLNVIQRMGGVATMTRRFQELARRCSPSTFIVGTRKTPWGLLDKRAVHYGGGGTHRLGLGDAILVKNNHLGCLASDEEEAVGLSLQRAWAFRRRANFLEVEVRGIRVALAAARIFRQLQERDPDSCPCLLLLDNMAPKEVARIGDALRAERLWDSVLVEASGSISEANVEAYIACGVDAISVGALTHSPRALDLCLRLSC